MLRKAWNHIRSPISMRAIAVLIALAFVGYTVINDYQQNQRSLQRYEDINRDVEAARAAIVGAERQFEIYEQATKNTTALLDYINKTTTGIQEVSEILQNERLERAKLQGATRRRRPRKDRVQTGCYRAEERLEIRGNTQVVLRDLVKTRCQ